MSTFVVQKLKEPSFFQRLFKITIRENFLKEINNLLASHEDDYTKVSETALSELMEKYRIKKLNVHEDVFKDFFIKILKQSLADEVLTEIELDGINHIRRLFTISEEFVKTEIETATKKLYTKKVNQVINDGFVTDEEKAGLEETKRNLNLTSEQADSILNAEIKSQGQGIYRNAVRWSISDGELSEQEKENLNRIQATLGLSESTADNIYVEEVSKVYNDYLNKAISDQRLSPDEDKELELLAKKLGIRGVDCNNATRTLLDKYRLYWLIENGDVPTIASDISLQRNENLYFKVNIDWNELRTVTTRVDYSGVSTRIKICKGVYFRAGTGTPQRETKDIYKLIDSGEMYLTNKRIIFMGNKGNKTIRLNKILSFSPYANGVEIKKDTGRSPFFAFNDNVELFSLLLSRAINDAD